MLSGILASESSAAAFYSKGKVMFVSCSWSDFEAKSLSSESSSNLISPSSGFGMTTFSSTSLGYATIGTIFSLM
jgi:hypothetical protein